MAEEDRPVKSGETVKISGVATFGAQQDKIEIEGVIVSKPAAPPETGPKK
jgi:hypothetical protein